MSVTGPDPSSGVRPFALVVGAGIGGLAGAVALGRAGWDVEVRERAPELRPLGAGLSLWPNAVRALDALGVGEAARAAGVAVTSSAIRRSDGRLLSDPGAATFPARFGAPLLAMHRADLHDVLRAALGPHVTLRLGTPVAGVDEVLADLVVAADGVDSGLRRALFGERHRAAPAGYVAWRAVVDLAVPGAGESWGRGVRFGWLPLPGGRTYWFATANSSATHPAPHTPPAGLATWHAPVPELLAAAPQDRLLRHDIVEVRPALPSFVAARTALLGDAAHGMTPDLGQGAAQALEDAVALAAAVPAGGDLAAGLVAYDRARRRRTQSIARRSHLMGRLGQLTGPAAALRDTVMRGTPDAATARGLSPILSGP